MRRKANFAKATQAGAADAPKSSACERIAAASLRRGSASIPSDGGGTLSRPLNSLRFEQSFGCHSDVSSTNADHKAMRPRQLHPGNECGEHGSQRIGSLLPKSVTYRSFRAEHDEFAPRSTREREQRCKTGAPMDQKIYIVTEL